jgi:exosortase A-associated hydrolase 1
MNAPIDAAARHTPQAPDAHAGPDRRPHACGPAGETGLVFPCGEDRLVGVLHPAAGRTGVVVIVGGPQVRVGSQRQFLLLARFLAGNGFPVLRFDVRGMGDSTGAQRSFEAISDDIGAALQALQRAQPQVERVVLWGLCDGASAALLYLHDRPDPRVSGLVLLNPWVRSAATQARAQVRHYYLDRLRQRDFWLKLLRGGVGAGALREFAAKLRLARAPLGGAAGHASTEPAAHSGYAPHAQLPYALRMARAWAAFRGPLLLVLSGRDYTAAEFLEACRADPAWAGALAQPHVTRHDAALADHTFSSAAQRTALFQATLAWLAAHGPPGDDRAAREGPGRA